jgi:hypothetical protein
MSETKLIKIIIITTSLLSINMYAFKGTSQPSNHGCYLEDGNGEIVDLSGLCGTGEREPSRSNNTSSTSRTTTRNFEVQIKRREGGTAL